GGPGGGSWDPWNRYPPAQPSSRPWVALGVALAIIVAAVLGFGLVSQMNGTRNNNALGTNPYYSGTSGNPALGAQVATKVDPGIVDINTVLDFGQGQAAGTGIILNSSGEVLTNNHVVEDATTIQATVVTTGKVYTGSVVGWDLNDDVAVVQLQGASGLQPASLGDSDKVGINDQVVALGNALGVGGTPSVAQGRVVALNQSITASDSSAHSQENLSGLIETNATLEPGDSGGPLANANGQVIGMDTAASTNYQFSANSGSSYAIPINQALSIAKQIEAGQNSGNVHNGLPGFLGVDVSDQGASGALVVLTLRNTAASSAGIGPGDVITSVAGQAIGSASDLTSVMSKQKPGAHVAVKWTDTNGQDHSSSLTLTTGPVP
ncbi:MAG TPA: trypsin-like peptidase domain-containing protein, partial [Actinomycetota bacterium]|nr:trypsin-like peptidase domain-containing protein [Actinomycetota bacterium]